MQRAIQRGAVLDDHGGREGAEAGLDSRGGPVVRIDEVRNDADDALDPGLQYGLHDRFDALAVSRQSLQGIPTRDQRRETIRRGPARIPRLLEVFASLLERGDPPGDGLARPFERLREIVESPGEEVPLRLEVRQRVRRRIQLARNLCEPSLQLRGLSIRCVGVPLELGYPACDLPTA